MIKFLILLLIVWALVSVAGAVIEGLIWLTFIGIALFLITAVVAFLRRGSSNTPG